MTLAEFERGLVAIIGRDTRLRPFVCEGSPLTCDVFIVGYNPATTMSTSFWDYWDAASGFDKSRFLPAYERDRRAARSEDGKTSDHSKSRGVMRVIEDAAGARRILETNVYALPTRQAKHLKKADQDPRPLRFLLEAIRPKVVLVHGKKTERHYLAAGITTPYEPVPHFRSYGHTEARAFGYSIRV